MEKTENRATITWLHKDAWLLPNAAEFDLPAGRGMNRRPLLLIWTWRLSRIETCFACCTEEEEAARACDLETVWSSWAENIGKHWESNKMANMINKE